MANITLMSENNAESIEADMTINDLGNCIEIVIANDIFNIEAIDEYPFFALIKIRQQLESKGYFILVNGCRINVYPSGMQYSTFTAYELELGKPAIKTVDIFESFSNPKYVATVKDQERFFYKWVGSIGG